MHRQLQPLPAVLTACACALVLASPANAVANAAPAGEARASTCQVPSDDGNKRRVLSALTKRYVVKQIDQDENFSGAPKELTFVLEKSKTVSNTVEKTAEVSASMSAGAFGSLEGKAGVNLGNQETTYAFSQVTEKLTLKSGDVYLRGRGVRKYALTTRWQACRQRSQQMVWVTWAKARAVGHLKVKAVVGCKQKTTRGSFSRVLKNYCP